MADAGNDSQYLEGEPGSATGEAFENRLTQYLATSKLLDEISIQRAKRARRQSGERFDLVLSRLGLLPEAELSKALAVILGLPLAARDELAKVESLHEQIPLEFARSKRIVPLAIDDSRVVLATADPLAGDVIEAIGFLLERTPVVRVAAAADIDATLDRIGSRQSAEAGQVSIADELANDADVRRLKDMASEAPIIRLVQETITRAVEMRASDIHVEPADDGLRLRFRIDGELRDMQRLPHSAKAAVASRIKIMANLNIAERRLPQDGRIKTSVRGNEIDLRVSSVPTLKGESIVLRILDRSSLPLTLPALGFGGSTLTSLESLLAQPNGIILVSGPTGSGKTTTLYAALSLLNKPGRKVFTVEDPIEYQIAGINQMQVQPRIGLTFASALRSILRQDPDTILVGEIRDLETAEMAIQSALTGHLVLSTIHTNSAAATITRLLQMGVEDYLLASTLKGVLAQRLVRCLCPVCATTEASPPAVVSELAQRRLQRDAHRGGHTRAAAGCSACGNVGFSGRTTISEVLVMTEQIGEGLLAKASERELEKIATSQGMTSMFDDGLTKVLSGQTVLDEVLRATRAT